MNTNMETNLPGRLRNTSLPIGNALLPVFEAVVNSVHAIEEAGIPSKDGRIFLTILRDAQQAFKFEDETKKGGSEPAERIVGFRITDNGIGFNDANMESFRTLDGEHKADKGGRGVGRLLWLKAFKRANVSSLFRNDEGEMKSRSFVFNAVEGIVDETLEDAAVDARNSTTVDLDGFEKEYRKNSLKTAPSIANSLLEHCLWYFVRAGGAPKIIVQDGSDVIELDTVYEHHMVSSAATDSFTIKDQEFVLTHVKMRATASRSHAIALCAASRLVKEENIAGKIPGLYGRLKDNASEFVYMCYVASDFLDKAVRSERTDFDILEDTRKLLSDHEIALDEIRDAVIAKASEHLSKYLAENRKRSKERVENFVAKKAPRYRPILGRIPEEKLGIDPGISDKELELTLHKQLADIEGQLLAEGHDVMSPKEGEQREDYQKRLQDYLKTVQDIKKSDLANYVFHRKVVLDLLGKAIQKGENGKYAREDLIHNLIMPMGTDSNGVEPTGCNLWLIDERLAFHDYLASDKTLTSMPITGCADRQEPDICALNVFDNPILVSEGDRVPLASIVIVEIKRPMRNDAAQGEEKDPIEQALDYLERIRQGKVTTASGRLIPRSEDVPGFCYVLCDITSTVEKRCQVHDAIRTSDGLGYFFYHKNFKAYLEVMSFDRLVNAAKERNRAFFDRLGLPTT
ncbi:MAG TPA: hypothetical protein VMY42_01360 [Thermoguttaceae bacterium]|nr:hypothetical protein [Thermoguttaceae bacterium]